MNCNVVPRRSGAHGRSLVILVLAAAVAIAGCATPTQRQAPELRRVAGKAPRIVLMPIDVELSQLTAGGIQEPHSEWTDAALKHMQTALRTEARARKVVLTDFNPDQGASKDRETAAELVRLHRAVGATVLTHQFVPVLALPSKEGKFDWALGPSVSAISRAHNADYALFIYVRDSYATAGRVAVIAIGAILGVGVAGGTQVGFASVVDLKTGNIVWFNRLLRGHGDLRTEDVAAETVKELVADALK